MGGMTDWDSLPFLDYDPDAREQATAASRDRVRQGFTELLDRLQRPLDEVREATRQRRLTAARTRNVKMGRIDGHFVPEGCSIPVSPEFDQWAATTARELSSFSAPT